MPNRREITGNADLPLWQMHHVTERVFVAERLRRQVRSVLGDEEYRFWLRDIHLFISGDFIAGALDKAHRHDQRAHGVWQDVPRLMLRSGNRYLNLALTADARAVQDVGKVTDSSSSVKFDRIGQAVRKVFVYKDRRFGAKAGWPSVIRFFGGAAGNLAGSVSGTRTKGPQWTRSVTGWLLRAVRAQDTSHVVKLGVGLHGQRHVGSAPGPGR